MCSQPQRCSRRLSAGLAGLAGLAAATSHPLLLPAAKEPLRRARAGVPGEATPLASGVVWGEAWGEAWPLVAWTLARGEGSSTEIGDLDLPQISNAPSGETGAGLENERSPSRAAAPLSSGVGRRCR